MKSMTGFGRADGLFGSNSFTIEIKSVNHKYLDCRFRLPPALSLYEGLFGEMLRHEFERGAFEIAVRHKLHPTGKTLSTGTKFAVDQTALESLVEAKKWIKEKYKIDLELTSEFLARVGHVFIPVEEQENPEGLLNAVKPIFEDALIQLSKMREAEGKKLKSILKEMANNLTETVEKIKKLATQQPKHIEEKIKARISQWELSTIDSQRMAMEVVFHADRSDLTEEIDRLNTHSKAFLKQIELSSSSGVGRKLDFLTQEMLRESNTLASKSALVEITQLAMEAKTLIEKLREQVQNVE